LSLLRHKFRFYQWFAYLGVALLCSSESNALTLNCKASFDLKDSSKVVLNTGNTYKKDDYIRLMSQSGRWFNFQAFHMREIDGTPEQVIVHKASQFHDPEKIILVEDSSLDVEGAEIGANIKWLSHLLPTLVNSAPPYRRALWRASLAYRQGDKVNLFVGEISGQIVPPRGDDHSFNSYFLPDGSNQTLGQFLDKTQVSARTNAFKLFLSGHPTKVVSAIDSWRSEWQEPPSLSPYALNSLKHGTVAIEIPASILQRAVAFEKLKNPGDIYIEKITTVDELNDTLENGLAAVNYDSKIIRKPNKKQKSFLTLIRVNANSVSVKSKILDVIVFIKQGGKIIPLKIIKSGISI
jgi:inosine/xanthosine triphosphate pyrophosphatase family protein